jgi:hypothetical protein
MHNLNEILATALLLAGLITFIVCAFWTMHNLGKDDKTHKIKKA